MILLGRYELLKGYGDHHISVGFGSYGQVKLAVDKKTGENVAVKIVHKVAKNQVGHHHKLCHPNIIQLLDSTIDPQREITYMILEYADGGTLFDKIQNQDLTKAQIKSYFRDVCQAIAYLHERQIMHRDIKPQNILLTSQGRAKLCDFGFAAILGERKTLCGTYQYMSPQMVQNRPYDYKIDIWALGILLFELIAGRAPFKGNSPQEVLNQMKTKIFFSEKFTPDQISLVKSIIRVTPHKRPSIKQILEHSYFTNSGTEEDAKSFSRSSLEGEKNPPKTSSGSNNGSNGFGVMQQKSPQNSYPFYVPKSQPVKIDGSFNEMGGSGIHTNKGSKSPIRMNPLSTTQVPYPQKMMGIAPRNNFNTSFGNYPGPNYRHS